MNFAKLDDRYDDHRKIKRAWRRNRAAVGLHAMAITYCRRHNTDGLVDIEWLEEKLPRATEREKVVAVLVDLGLFDRVDDETWRVHDYLDFQDSSEQRAARVAAGKKAADARWNAKGMRSASDSHAPPSTEKSREEESRRDTVASGDIETVFAYWQHRTGRTGAALTPDRRRVLTARLRDKTADELKQAVDGSQTPGAVNEKTGHRYDDFLNIFRNVNNVEANIDRAQGRGKPVSAADLADRINRAQEAAA